MCTEVEFRTGVEQSSSSRTMRAAKLRYAPKLFCLYTSTMSRHPANVVSGTICLFPNDVP